MQGKQNCWEFKHCTKAQGCPAYSESKLNGVHHGDNAGRACWVVAGTLCGGNIQGVFAQKMSNCKQCDFYKQVVIEEEADFKLSSQLIPLLG